ncbi:choice-of-anchor A family protein [Hyalangium gracile]|uniref:choice-of-anchor A family protein n=1 Tax=Hyalangium gracile TaxID=394092 RepID=UPI001CCBDB94|nr:choice-of-anchor A family protein [Hyalangium gracile]
MALSCGERDIEPFSRSTNKVLILASSVSGGLRSREAVAAGRFYGSEVHVVTPSQWRAMSAEQFMTYRALVIGDAACQSGTDAFQAAIDSRSAWGAIVDGNVALLATDPTSNGTEELVERAIHFVLDSPQYLTAMYIALGCAYQSAPPDTAVPLLEPFGTFRVTGVQGCADSGHLFQMSPSLLSDGLTDDMLSGDGCAARSVFTTYPEHTFAFAALAKSSTGAPIPGQRTYLDYSEGEARPEVGTPYLVVRGAAAQSAGCGTPDPMTGEECDLGDLLNGAPAVSGQPARETCSWSCRNNWCGDGVVDTVHGEECDEGIKNGRTGDANATIGTCTSFCKRPQLPSGSHPPVALCRNVTVTATLTCGLPADINEGSSDPDGDLVGCTQSPEGPYDIGTTTVTLTCTDRANHAASCSGVVEVLDKVPPTLTVSGPPNLSRECTAGATFTPPGATASDPCDGPLPQSSITVSGSVNLGEPRPAPGYTLSYVATDAAGNRSAPAVVTVTVADTLPPALTLQGSPSLSLVCGAPFVEPGATAHDQCEGDITSRIVTSGNVNTSVPGQYTLSYRVADRGGRVATASRRVSIVGTEIRLSDYTLFVLRNYTGGMDVRGKVAAGGNIHMMSFSVGEDLPNNNVSRLLVAGGNLNLTSGSVWGEAFYGGAYSTGGGVTFHRGTLSRGAPIDFAARFTQLRSLSAQLAALTPTGTATRSSGGYHLLSLSGTNPKVNVFEVQGSALNGLNQLDIRAPAGSLAIINIRGTTATLSNMGITMSGGIDAHGILYNLPEATTFHASSIGIWGTLLAPHADVTFNNGNWDGGIYAVSMTGTAEGHLNVLNDRASCQ